jgi:ApbE superfamily uncharacterized protein (UPF0280 family)
MSHPFLEMLDTIIMTEYKERTYRKLVRDRDLVSFNVIVKETDLWVSADKELVKETRDLIIDYRRQLESYIQTHPEYVNSLNPYPEDKFAPEIVKMMIRETEKVGVGPMASVAGAIAQYVGNNLLDITDQVIVENGGDIYLKTKRDVTISIFAGESPLSNRVGIVINVHQMPLGVCSSSGTVGHSLSMGNADVVCILSSSAILADGAATALGNRVRSEKDLGRIADWANEIDGITGGVAVLGERMAIWGEVELVKL